MTRDPQWKQMRRFGVNLFGTRSPGLAKRLDVPPGQHGRRRARKPSEYALQLREKQKARLTYGANERQFRRTFERAQHIWVGRRAERGFQSSLSNIRQAGHGIQATAADDSDLCL